jgi:hypothetical protein
MASKKSGGGHVVFCRLYVEGEREHVDAFGSGWLGIDVDGLEWQPVAFEADDEDSVISLLGCGQKRHVRTVLVPMDGPPSLPDGLVVPVLVRRMFARLALSVDPPDPDASDASDTSEASSCTDSTDDNDDDDSSPDDGDGDGDGDGDEEAEARYARLCVHFACPGLRKPPLRTLRSASAQYPDLILTCYHATVGKERGSSAFASGTAVTLEAPRPWSAEDVRNSVWDCPWSLVTTARGTWRPT